MAHASARGEGANRATAVLGHVLLSIESKVRDDDDDEGDEGDENRGVIVSTRPRLFRARADAWTRRTRGGRSDGVKEIESARVGASMGESRARRARRGVRRARD